MSLFQFVIRHRRAVLVLWCALIVVGVFGASGVRQDFSVESYFPSDDPKLEVYDEFKARFPQEVGQVVAFWRFGNALNPRSFAVLAETAQAFRGTGLQDVIWMGSARSPDLSDVLLEVDPPLLPESPSAEQITHVLDRFGENPLFRGMLWDADERVFVVRGLIPPEQNDTAFRHEVASSLEDTLSGLGRSDDEWVLSGVPILRARYLILLEKDQALFIGGGLLLCFIVLALFLGNLVQVWAVFMSIVPAYLLTLSGLAWVDRPITALTAAVPIILLVIGLSDSIHLLMRVRTLREHGLGLHASVAKAFSGLARNCLFTSVTTAVGFLCLLSTGIEIVMDFAVVTALAVLLAYVANLVFAPAFLATFGGHSHTPETWLARRLESVVQAARLGARRYGRWIVGAALLSGIASLAAFPRLFVDVRMIDERPEHPLVQDIQWIEESDFGVFQVNLQLEPNGGEVARGETIEWIREFVGFAESDPLVLRSLSLADWVDAPVVREGIPRSAVERSLLRMLDDPLESVDSVETVYHRESGASQVVLFVRDGGSQRTEALLERLREYLLMHPLDGVRFDLTGTVVLSQLTFLHLVDGFKSSVFWALLAVAIVLFVQLRSIRFTLVALIPNVLPLVVMLGALAVLSIPVTPAVVLVFSIAFGIAVDDTIHFLGSIAKGRAEGMSYSESADSALGRSGRAIVLTTIVVAGGFSVLMLSSFQATFMLGSLTVTALIAALIADLFVLTSLLHLLDGESDV